MSRGGINWEIQADGKLEGQREKGEGNATEKE
jgi:hypothetical protein